MKTIDVNSLIKELRASGTTRALRMANRLERRYLNANADRKNSDIMRGATFNIATQHNEVAKYLVSLDPLTEVHTTLTGTTLRVDHTYVPIETAENSSALMKLLLDCRGPLTSYAEMLKCLADTSNDDESIRWGLATVTAILNGIDKL